MKVELESSVITNRGIEVTSETEEERQILMELWVSGGTVVSFTRIENSQNIRLGIAPTSQESLI